MSDARMHAALTRVDALHEALDASRAREAKLVEALRKIANDPYEFGSRIQAMKRTAAAALSLYDTPAEMPSDVHPQEG